jgi:hypothetical protein
MHKYSEVDIKETLGYRTDIFVVFGNQIFHQTIEIPMGTNYDPLLADLFSYSYEAAFIEKLLHKKNKPLVVAFNLTFRDIDDDLSTNNDQLHLCINFTHPTELQIKDTIESSTSAS